MNLLYAVVAGLIAFILALWVISLVAAGMAYGHLLAVLIGVLVGLGVYFRGPWRPVAQKMILWHWFLTVTGSNNTAGTWYGFWSGFAGDLFLFGGIITIYKKHNCHVHNCWRIGKHPVEGTPYTTCKKHHPGIQYGDVSVKQIHEAHSKFKRGNRNVKSH